MKKILSIILTLSVVLTPNGNVCTAHETVPATSIQTSGENQSKIKNEISKKYSTAMKSLKGKISNAAKSVKEFAQKNKKTITWSSMGATATTLLGLGAYEFYRLMKDKGLLDFIKGQDGSGEDTKDKNVGKPSSNMTSDDNLDFIKGQYGSDPEQVKQKIEEKFGEDKCYRDFDNNSAYDFFNTSYDFLNTSYSEFIDTFGNPFCGREGGTDGYDITKWLTYAGYAGGAVAGVLGIGAAAYFVCPSAIAAIASGFTIVKMALGRAKVAPILPK